jgi:hypothetical protein
MTEQFARLLLAAHDYELDYRRGSRGARYLCAVRHEVAIPLMQESVMYAYKRNHFHLLLQRLGIINQQEGAKA